MTAADVPDFDVQAVKYVLMAAEMDRAVRFYQSALGLQLRTRSQHWSELVHGEAVVALHGGGTGARSQTGLSIQVSDVEAACRRVQDLGGEVLQRPRQREGEPIRLATVVDPEGNQFALTQYTG